MKFFRLTGFQLKILGLVLMVFDHIAQFMGASAPIYFHWLGRPVFPIFLFLSVEGYKHTRNKEKYMLRLLIGFWFMGLMTTIIQYLLPSETLMIPNNVFGTIFLCVLYMYAIDMFILYVKENNLTRVLISLIIMIIPIRYFTFVMYMLDKTDNYTVFTVLYRAFPSLMTVEGGFLMVILGVLLYIFKFNKYVQVLPIIVVAAITIYGNPGNLLTSNYQWMMVFSIIPILLYNGKKGKDMKNFFYIFYPAHIYALYLIFYFLENFDILLNTKIPY